MSKKDTQSLIDEFLKRGGKIEVLPAVESDSKEISVSKVKIQAIDLISIGEAIDLYGEKQKRNVKKKKPDMSSINKDLIPESLHGIINLYEEDN